MGRSTGGQSMPKRRRSPGHHAECAAPFHLGRRPSSRQRTKSETSRPDASARSEMARFSSGVTRTSSVRRAPATSGRPGFRPRFGLRRVSISHPPARAVVQAHFTVVRAAARKTARPAPAGRFVVRGRASRRYVVPRSPRPVNGRCGPICRRTAPPCRRGTGTARRTRWRPPRPGPRRSHAAPCAAIGSARRGPHRCRPPVARTNARRRPSGHPVGEASRRRSASARRSGRQRRSAAGRFCLPHASTTAPRGGGTLWRRTA